MSEWLRTLTTKQANASLHRKTVKNIVGLLNVILEWAREQRYLANDPLAAYRRQARKRRKAAAAPAREVRHLEPAELHALLNAAADDTVAEIILYLAAYSGVRRGELFALQWSDVDEETAQLSVRRSIYQRDITRPKTETSTRRVDLPAPLVTRLKAYREQCPAIAPGFIFRTKTGSPLDPDNWFRRVFVPIAVAAKLREHRSDANRVRLLCRKSTRSPSTIRLIFGPLLSGKRQRHQGGNFSDHQTRAPAHHQHRHGA